MRIQGQISFFLLLSLVTTNLFAIPYNTPYGVSPISHQIYNLHMAAFYVSCVIGAFVFCLVFFSIYKYRKSKGAKAAHFHENIMVEIIWTAIPFLILVALAVPSTLILMNIHDTEKAAFSVKVTGYQWKWQYEYLDYGIKFFSFLSTPQDQIFGHQQKNPWYLLEVDHPMVIPINTKVKLLITADDVVHSWWVPELGVKQDAIPGFINENWLYATTPGTYRGQCGELCGINHAFMPIVVQAVTETEFANWVMSQQKLTQIETQKEHQQTLTQQELLAIGKEEYEKNCAMCHRNDGEGMYGSYPALKQSRVVTAPVDETIVYIMRGVPSSPMQAFGKILDDRRLAGIVTYIRSAWGNQVIIEQKGYSTLAQPSHVANIRNNINYSMKKGDGRRVA